MVTLQGAFNSAKVFSNIVEEQTQKQILEICDTYAYRDSKIRIMPDCHSGIGCVVGTTMTITDKISPPTIGVDIGCGVLAVAIKLDDGGYTKEFLKYVDAFIASNIPYGFSVNKIPSTFIDLAYWENKLRNLTCTDIIDHKRTLLSLSSLGGGNHFIEISKSVKTGKHYLIVHTGSRHLGVEVEKYHRQVASRKCTINLGNLNYLENEDLKNYLHDMAICQEYAMANRTAIIKTIMAYATLSETDGTVESVHNYIDLDNSILRKGAISAQKDENVIIPINMRDGSIIGIGKGNPDWNFSAPHGAGRLMSRNQAKKELSLDEFKKSMTGIYTSSVSSATLDEAPGAYKPMQEILDAIQDTVTIKDIILPIYNFKAQ